MIAILQAILRFFGATKLSMVAFFAWISSNFITFFIAIQLITWAVSAIFTILLGFYGTEILEGIFDLTGISSFVSNIMGTLSGVGDEIDSIGTASSFNGTFSQAMDYFNFIPFINFMVSFWFGVFALKINVAIARSATMRGTSFSPLSNK